MSKHSPTDHQCLHAAERALAAHRETRPATPPEIASMAARWRALAYEHLAEVARIEAAPRHSATCSGRGNATGHMAAEHARAAHVAETQAAALYAICDDPAAAWGETERVLTGRVARYAGLIDARRAAHA